jgi:hypothetical protein
MDTIGKIGGGISALFTGVIGLAILAIVLSNSSNTVNVIQSFFSGLTSLIGTVVTPVSGGSSVLNSGTSSVNGLTNTLTSGLGSLNSLSNSIGNLNTISANGFGLL